MTSVTNERMTIRSATHHVTVCFFPNICTAGMMSAPISRKIMAARGVMSPNILDMISAAISNHPRESEEIDVIVDELESAVRPYSEECD